ncbi:MAG: aminotransferase class V-fold PLP-dependent enzyme [Myxococcales bacterium]|nr:aminotransferase class V-fold PLP-dependent enzyme [Myxococcales bacterium]
MTYLDHAATTPALPEVVDAMLPWLREGANAASVHRAGQRAAAAVEAARAQVAALLGRPEAGLVFTSGATEANHHAIAGWVAAGARAVAVSAIEHPCVPGAVEAAGLQVRPLPVSPSGVADPSAASEDADLLVLMAANHETGVRQPVQAAARVAAQRGIPLHVDAAQALGKGEIPGLAEAHSVVASGHKLGGPMGVGVLSLLDAEPFAPLLRGGVQERGRRAGTLNVAGIVGFGVACERAAAEQRERVAQWVALSSLLRRELVAMGGRIVGGDAQKLPTHTCVVFGDLPAEALVQALDLQGVAVSAGAACASGSVEPSPVLTAMGDPNPSGGVRISLGATTTTEDVRRLLDVLPRVIEAHRLLG